METTIFLFFYIYIYIAELLINQILDNKIDKYIPILSNSKQPKFNQNPVNKKSMNKLFPSDPDWLNLSLQINKRSFLLSRNPINHIAMTPDGIIHRYYFSLGQTFGKQNATSER